MSLCFHDNKTNFNRALQKQLKDRLCPRKKVGFKAENQTVEFIPPPSLPVLRLRGGASGDEENWLCDICGKSLMSKRNLDQHMDSVHVSHPDFTCVKSLDGLLKWKCSICGNLISSKQ